jgi:hypothetical protein
MRAIPFKRVQLVKQIEAYLDIGLAQPDGTAVSKGN